MGAEAALNHHTSRQAMTADLEHESISVGQNLGPVLGGHLEQDDVVSQVWGTRAMWVNILTACWL